jgi:hypothetical protein
MVAAWNTPHPDPIAPLGRNLCDELFGQHPWDFIQAPAPNPSEKPQWRTVTDYPLRPRVLWASVGKTPTNSSAFASIAKPATACSTSMPRAPTATQKAIAQIRAALETLGIVRTLLIRSSHSGGLHLYIPLPEPVKTFDLAVALHECLTAQGFQFTNGQLEQFPNVKTYGNEKIIHYNGHRLPLQPGTGSCLLDDDLNPISDRLADFLHQWQQAASQQDLRRTAPRPQNRSRQPPQTRQKTAPSQPPQSSLANKTSKPKSTTAGAALARPTTCSKPLPATATSSWACKTTP